MSLFASCSTLPFYSDSEVENNHKNGEQLSLGIEDRGNQKSLLYQALFLPDKTAHSGAIASKPKCRSIQNETIISTGLISPPLKGNRAFTQDQGKWNKTCTLSSSTESLIGNLSTPLSQSSDSTSSSWNALNNSATLGSKTQLQQLCSSETYICLSKGVDQQSMEDLCQDRDHQANQDSTEDLSHDPLIPYKESSQSPVTNDAFQVINNQCFEAAISERVKITPSDKYRNKIKPSKGLRTGSKGFPSQNVITDHLQQRQIDKVNHHRHHQRHRDKNKQHNKKVTDALETSCASDFLAPSTPSPLSASGDESPKSPASSGPSDVTGHKKYRYNQTFSALQQSGLMKTTMKTAELLRRSRSLQQELAKLRRDTTMFVECVLNNPQNKHIKEQLERNKTKDVGQAALPTVTT